MNATLYGIPGCPHTTVAELLLERRQVPYRRINLPYPFHPFLVRRILRFDGDTVPALVVNGRRLQQTRTIARALAIEPGAEEEWTELELRRLKRNVLHAPKGLEAALSRIDAFEPRDEPTSAELHAAVLVRLIGCFEEVRPRPALELADRLCPTERFPGKVASVIRTGARMRAPAGGACAAGTGAHVRRSTTEEGDRGS